jgi:hypothetical protein
MSSRVVVIGDPNSIFVTTPVRYWRDRGVDAVILTSRWEGPPFVDGDLPVISAESLAPEWMKTAAHGLYPLLDAVNADSLSRDPGRVTTALKAWAHTAVPPSVAPPVFDALLIAAAADALDPACVFGHEAFAYGLATSLCRAPRRALFAWGADVLQYAAMSDVAGAMVRTALHGVHYVLTNSQGMEDALHERFGVPRTNIAQISYGVDRRQFSPADAISAARIRAAHGIPPTGHVVMNVRRFLPHWGSKVAWPVMAAVAEQRPDTHLVLLGGPGSDAELDGVAADAKRRGLMERVTVMRGNVPLSTVAELMSIATVGLSLVEPQEPVSWSVLQAAACGSALVIGEQRSYAEECARGLAAIHVPTTNEMEALTAVLSLLDDEGTRTCMRAANDAFVTARHNTDAHLTRLLRIVAGGDTADRLLTSGCRPASSLRSSDQPAGSFGR